MENEIPDAWGDTISLTTLTPAMILNYQAERLKHKTQGLIIGELTALQSKETTTLLFDLLAPAAKNLRTRVLTVKYNTDQVYPVVVAGAGIAEWKSRSQPVDLYISDIGSLAQTAAYSENEFVNAIGVILQSPAIRSKIASLIAQSNEVKNPPKGLRIESLDAPVGASGIAG